MPGAVEAPRREAAPEVVHAEEALRLRDDRRARVTTSGASAAPSDRADAVRRAHDASARPRRAHERAAACRSSASSVRPPCEVERRGARRRRPCSRPSRRSRVASCEHRQPARIAVRILRVGLVAHRDLRPAAAAPRARSRAARRAPASARASRARRATPSSRGCCSTAPGRPGSERRAVDRAVEVRRLPERRDRDVDRRACPPGFSAACAGAAQASASSDDEELLPRRRACRPSATTSARAAGSARASRPGSSCACSSRYSREPRAHVVLRARLPAAPAVDQQLVL